MTKATMSASDDIAQLHLSPSLVSFVAGTVSLTVPSGCAERSVLISELRQGAKEGELLPLPLSMEDTRAWLACGPLNDTMKLPQLTDDELLRAHKAADFLQDSSTREAVLQALANVVGQAVEDADLHPSTEAERRTQVLKVLQALPPLSTLHLLTTVKQRPCPKSHSWPGCEHMLLRLLPRTYHPAVVQACCMSDAVDPRCAIDTHACETPLPDRETDEHYRELHSHDDDMIVAARTKSMTAFQLLAAAAPLAGGSFDLAWAAASRTRSTCSDTDLRDVDSSAEGEERRDRRAAKRMRMGTPPVCAPADGGDRSGEEHECDWRMRGQSLRRLDLRFDVDDVQLMPSRWCTALAQLATLRELRLELYSYAESIESGFKFCSEEFSAALLCLLALRKLTIRFDLNKSDCALDSCVLAITPRSTLPLLDTVSKMPQLTGLDLDGCVSFHGNTLSLPGTAHAHETVSQLSRLAHLTSLRLGMFVDAQCLHYAGAAEHVWTMSLGCALKQLPVLAKLHVDLVVCDSRARVGEPGPEEFIVELLSGPGLPALEHLHIAMDCEGVSSGTHHGSGRYPTMLFQRLNRCLRFHHQALLARMTALSFGRFELSPVRGACDAAMLVAMVARMTALQSLALSSTQLRDSGLIALSRVLRHGGLPGLTHLDISDTDASHTGVLAVLRALPQPDARGHAGLQSLNITRSCFMAARRQFRVLARLLGRCHGLVELDMVQLGLGMEGLGEVLEALGGLQQLRCVNAFGNISYVYVDPGPGNMTDGMLKALANTVLPDTEFMF